MSRSKQQKIKASAEVLPPLNVLDRIDSLLQEHLVTFPSKGELTAGEIEHWHQDLSPFPIKAIDWAFDCWRRNGRFFPVYGDILDLCIAWSPPGNKYSAICDEACKKRHGRGYGLVDIKIMGKLVDMKIADKDRPAGQRLSDQEIEEILEQVDKKRGSSPEWRHQRVIA